MQQRRDECLSLRPPSSSHDVIYRILVTNNVHDYEKLGHQKIPQGITKKQIHHSWQKISFDLLVLQLQYNIPVSIRDS